MTAQPHPHWLEAAESCPTPLVAALQALDARLAREVRRVRNRGALPLDELRGLYASGERVERLLAPAHELSSDEQSSECDDEPFSDPLLAHPAWRALCHEIAPSPLERDLVLLAMARDLRLDYELVFGFLNDDLTRRSPTRDLALRLLARDDDERSQLRAALGERAPLVSFGVLRFTDAGDHTSWLAAGVCVTPLAVALLADHQAPETRLPPGVTLLCAHRLAEASHGTEATRARLARITHAHLDAELLPLVICEGREGSGRSALAADLALTMECPLIRVDVRCGEAERALAAALLWQRLSDAVVLVDGVESWCTHDDAAPSPPPPPPAVLDLLGAACGPVLVRLQAGTRWHAAFGALRVAHVEMPAATLHARAAAWCDAVTRCAPRSRIADVDARVLADRFDLTSGRIARITRRAADEGMLDGASRATLSSADVARRLSDAARAESRDALGALAVRAPTPHAWDDLILPAPTMVRLRDFAAAIRDRAVVLDQWGFGRRATRARGVSALFAGASGTGKTMAASVIARELALDLFVIDLSGVVSKYIGETERNLDKVFRAARDAGAILFFDEADALFGKRSEVKDAHDRYANIEVAYLLQQLDSHDGIVILATNLSRNLDAAFSRRMRYVVEFPLPGELDRLRLWRGIFPAEAPLDADVDLAFLAANFPLAGGDIRNVALEAAYLAAADSRGTIAMRHLVRAMARQLAKQGKTPSAADFRHFVALLDRDG